LRKTKETGRQLALSMTASLLQIIWQNRAFPLVHCAVVARGEAARVLARRLLTRDDESLSSLSGVAGENLLLVLGEANNLPWANGALYLGRDVEAPSLFLPTTLAPDVPISLFERALQARFAQLALPLAVLPQWNLILPCGAAQMIARRELEKFVGAFEN
jgi:hypothetical protein